MKTRRLFTWMLSLLAPLAMMAATHEYVDLGLPSGTLWAKTNLGASAQEGYGNYYAWGETTTKTTYSWSNYKYCSGTSSTVQDLGKSICGTSYDAARALWGSEWRMPSVDQMNELIDKCTLQLKTVNGVKGLAFKGPNGNSIFFPIPGYKYDSTTTGKGSETYYWSGTKDLLNQDKTRAICLYIKITSSSAKVETKTAQRRTGLPIRPVRSSTTPVTPTPTETLQLVDLGLSVKWANMNVDATASSDKGGYYAWGETATKTKYSWATYKYCSGTAASCQNIGSDISKNATYDKAFKDNSSYCLPTAAQWNELITKCTWTAATVNGVKGYNVKGPNNKTIFLPFSGCSYDGKDYGSGSYAYYWSSNNLSSDVSKARAGYVKSGTATTVANLNRRTGCAIRAVEAKAGSTDPTPTETLQLVDLGLSVKWANMNVGATASSDKGGYYAWGETATKTKYSWATYKYCSGTAASCQNIGSDISKNATYDKAFKDNSSYCLPTAAQWNELITKCTWTAATVNGVKGYNVKGPNNKTIFLPFSGCSYDGKDYGSGSYAYYWSSNNLSSDVSKARAGYVKSGTATTVANLNRRTGCAIRAVEAKAGSTDPTPTGPTTSATGFVDMGFSSGKLWATANVGASAPEKYGKYYAWGETETKSTYTWANYAYYDRYSSGNHEYYYIDADDIGGSEVDVAGGFEAANGGGAYQIEDQICVDPAYSDTRFNQNSKTYYSRMPSQADFQELISNTTQAAATVNGVKGVMFTSKKNGNKVFLPYAGSYYDAKKPSDGTVTYYWTSTDYTSDSKKAWSVKLASGAATMTQCQCRTGLPVRAVAYVDDGSTPTPTTTEPYAVLSSDKKTLTFYYDNQKSSRSGTKFELNTGTNNPGWLGTPSTMENTDKITKVVFNSSFANARPTSCYHWFFSMSNLATITGLNYLNTSEVTTMSGMFYNCFNLNAIDVSNFDTSKVTDMQYMFSQCVGLTSLNLSNFNTSNVTNMSYMIHNCANLTDLNVRSFDIRKVTNMENMFSYCGKLSRVDLSTLDFRSGINTSSMLSYCNELNEIDINVTAKYWNNNACYRVPEGCYLVYPIGLSESELGITPYNDYYLKFKGGVFLDLLDALPWAVTDFIDLGLPSKTMWNLYNVGSMHPEYHGKHYAWSEVDSKSDYTWANYSQDVSNLQNYNFGYWNGNQNFGYGVNVHNNLSYDNSLYNAGVPTKADFTELINNCTMKETTVSGVKGVLFTSKKNGKTIFLPYAGSCYDGKTPADGTASYYWTSTSSDSQKAYSVSLKSGKATSTTCQKRTGLPYRSVAHYVRELDPSEYSNSGNFYIDGISNTKVQAPADNAIYTLQGVKVEGTPQRGIYVKNGRKIVVK